MTFEALFCVVCNHKYKDWDDKCSHKCPDKPEKPEPEPRAIDQGRSISTRLTDAEIMRRGFED